MNNNIKTLMDLSIMNFKVHFYALNNFCPLCFLAFRAKHDVRVPFVCYRIGKNVIGIDICLGKALQCELLAHVPWGIFVH